MNNCYKCNKKISFLRWTCNECRCTNHYCNKHKKPENHECSFNYIEHNKIVLEKKNIKVINVKITKI